MISKFDRWPSKTIGHLFYATSSFVYHSKAIGEFKLELQSGNAQFESKLAIFLSRVISKYDGWPWIKIGHLFYATSRFVHNFNEFKLELQPGNAEFGSKSAIFFVPRDLEISWMIWWMKSIGYLFYATSSFVHHLVSTCEIKLELQSWNAQFGCKSAIFFVTCDLEIWQMTLKNNRAPLLHVYYFKLCASFHGHQWIRTEVTVVK